VRAVVHYLAGAFATAAVLTNSELSIAESCGQSHPEDTQEIVIKLVGRANLRSASRWPSLASQLGSLLPFQLKRVVIPPETVELQRSTRPCRCCQRGYPARLIEKPGVPALTRR
jgi:hypothetical protein